MGTIALAWDPNTETNLAGYRLYVGRSPGTYLLKQTLAKTQTGAQVSGLEVGLHYFVVTAFNTAWQESGFSNELVHQEGAAMAIKVLLNWNPVTTYEDGSPLTSCTYDVFRGAQSNMSDRSKVNSNPLMAANFEDTNVVSGQNYYYQVRAGSSPASDYSAIVPAGTKKPAQPVGLTAVVVMV